MPTRKRPHLIKHALESALSQTVSDLEVVVSDNNPDDESTAKVVRSFQDERIVHTKPNRVLGMPANWEYALQNSHGERVIVLEDDCVLSSRCLEFVEVALAMRPVELVAWDWTAYFSNQHPDQGRRNQYVLRPFRSGVSFLSSSEELKEVYALRFRGAHPRPYNACITRAAIDRIIQRRQRAYPPPAPDYTFLPAALAMVDQYAFINVPLMLSDAGTTTPHFSQRNFDVFSGELGEEDKKSGYTPIRLPTVCPWNIMAESICRAQREIPELEPYSLDLTSYLVDYICQLLEFRDRGFAVGFGRSTFREFVGRLPTQQRVAVYLGAFKRRAKWVASDRIKKHLFRQPRLARWVGSLTNRAVVCGADAGFANIGDAMKHVDRSYTSITLAALGNWER